MQKVNVLGVSIDPLRLDEMLAYIQGAIAADQRALVAHVNATGLCLACEHAWLRQFFNQADLVFCDGMGVKLAARLLGYHIPERYTLADWMWRLIDVLACNNHSLYLLGNPPGVPERAAGRLQAKCSGLTIAGTQHGFFDKTPGSAENEAVLDQINSLKPDILMVGMGMPLQERWLNENWPRLDVNVAVTCGALFEYIAGDLPRGPRWMTDHYLEWLARLLISPRRYGKRYLRDNPVFLYRVLMQKFHKDPYCNLTVDASQETKS